MSQLSAGATPVFHATIPALSTASVAHPDTWNPIHQALLENDVVLQAAIGAVDSALEQFGERLDSVEVSSSAALDRAMRLNWLYGSARMSLELFTDAWSLRDMGALAVTSGIAGDDSIDLASTAGLVVGQEYVLFAGGTQETVKIAQVLTDHRVRINGVLANAYGAGAKLARTNWAIGEGLATANDGAIYYSKSMNLSASLGNHVFVVRRTASTALVRLYYTDINHPAWTECALVQQISTGVTDLNMADYLYSVPALGDFRLKLVVVGGQISLKHLAAVTGKATTLGGYGIGDAYTKPEVDTAISAIPKTRVVTLPSITGSSSVTPATNFTVTAASTSRLSGATIASFDFTKPDGTKQNVVAASGSASLTMQVSGSIGDTRNLLIEAIDSEGNRSAIRTFVLTVTANNAPSMATFGHTVPASVAQASAVTVKFYGATDADGDAITYSIDAGASGLTFSKASGIAANENVTMTVPGSVLPSKPVSFTVYAVDNKGAQTPVTISITIVGQTVWEFTTAGVTQWTAPVTGNYEVVEKGGGAGGGNGNGSSSGGAGAGSGYLYRQTFNIAAGTALPATVGAAGTAGQNGGTTSLGTLLTAPGGMAGEHSSQIASGTTKGGNGGSAGGSGSGGGMGANGGKDGSQQPYTAGSADLRKGTSQGTGLITTLNDVAFTPGDGGVGTAESQNCGGGAGGLLVNGTGPNAGAGTGGSYLGATGGKGYGAGGGGGYATGGAGTQGYMRIKFLGV